jgi:hypothetical protein
MCYKKNIEGIEVGRVRKKTIFKQSASMMQVRNLKSFLLTLILKDPCTPILTRSKSEFTARRKWSAGFLSFGHGKPEVAKCCNQKKNTHTHRNHKKKTIRKEKIILLLLQGKK